jgi:hypothetical protein
VLRRLPQPEIVIGRSLALCVHPYAAWRVRSKSRRAFILFAYAAVGYAITLSVMLAL